MQTANPAKYRSVAVKVHFGAGFNEQRRTDEAIECSKRQVIQRKLVRRNIITAITKQRFPASESRWLAQRDLFNQDSRVDAIVLSKILEDETIYLSAMLISSSSPSIKARSKTAISSSLPSQPAVLSLRPPKKNWVRWSGDAKTPLC